MTTSSSKKIKKQSGGATYCKANNLPKNEENQIALTLRRWRPFANKKISIRRNKRSTIEILWCWQIWKRKRKRSLKNKHKADVFQRVCQSTTKTIQELWHEQNTNKYRPFQGKKRMAKITEATQTITELYSLWSMIMPQYDLRYFAKSFEKMLEQSALRMLAWATRWKWEFTRVFDKLNRY